MIDLQHEFFSHWYGKCSFVVASFLSFLVGGFDMLLVGLLVISTYDVVIGTSFSLITKDPSLTFNSNIGLMGVMKKILMLATVSIAKYLDIFLGFDVIRNLTVVYYIINNIMSVFELHTLYNVPLPSFINRYLKTWIKNLQMEDEFIDEED